MNNKQMKYEIKIEGGRVYKLDVFSNVHMNTLGILTLRNPDNNKIYYWDTIQNTLNNTKIISIINK